MDKTTPHRNRSPLALLLGTCLLGTVMAAAGQVPAGLQGPWRITWQAETKVFEASVTLTAEGGVWRTATMSKQNPCAGREVSMKLESATDQEAQFVLPYSQVIGGCKDVTVVLKLAPDGSVTGTRNKFQLTQVQRD